jgi:hypothetical protein
MILSPDETFAILQKLMAQGLSATEAMAEFEKQDLDASTLKALMEDGTSHPLWVLSIQEMRESSHRETLEGQCYELWMNGWTVEPNGRDESWAWYWRRPARRAGQKGRKFLSTNQAFNALKREQSE